MSHLQNLPVSPPMSPRQGPSIFQFLDLNGDAPRDAVHANQIASQNGDGRIVTSPSAPHTEGRVLILCFDGTGNKFGAEVRVPVRVIPSHAQCAQFSQNSNIVRFFRALQKDDHRRQIVYYQPGIGTYNKRTFITHSANAIASSLDAAVALHLDDHVKEGYQYIAQNYRPGDKICIFGFSRGAHTARVVAGMVYKVGILPKENIQQVDFAFNVYGTTGYNGYKLSQEFKRTFTPTGACRVSVDFVGVWDTVSSVGLIPKFHPYTSVNYAVKKFRHALSLDERRARFRPNVWSEITLAREHELDVDIPVPDVPPTGGEVNRDDFEYKPPQRDYPDVKEVWFAGTHADVGGGSHLASRSSSLSYIPLRWMIKECILSETGIIFDLEYLREDLDFDFEGLLNEIGDDPEKQDRIIQYDKLKVYRDIQLREKEMFPAHVAKEVNGTAHREEGPRRRLLINRLRSHARDILDEIFDQLIIFWYFWWMLELIPMLYSYQDYHGNWIRRRMRNFGRGRYIPVYKNKVLVHSSVKDRIQVTGGDTHGKGPVSKISGVFHILLDRFRNRKIYTPRAYNWDYLQQQDVIEYVD